MLSQLGGQGIDTLGGLLGGQSPEEFQKLFQQAYVDPAMLQYQQKVLPSIQSQFNNLGGGSSSALNQALAGSANDLTTQLGGYAGQMYGQQQQQRLAALQQLMGSGLGQYGQPIIQQSPLGGILGAAGMIGGGLTGNPALFAAGASQLAK
jgi:hypothetical protein